MTTLYAALAAALLTPPPAVAAGDRDTWTIAKAAAAKYHVSATLLVSIRLHENPLRRNDYKACGVKDPTGRHRWYPGGLRGQLYKCAEIVSRYAKRHGWDPEQPTKSQVRALGKFYAEGSTHWGSQVWSLYRRMRPTRAEVAK